MVTTPLTKYCRSCRRELELDEFWDADRERDNKVCNECRYVARARQRRIRAEKFKDVLCAVCQQPARSDRDMNNGWSKEHKQYGFLTYFRGQALCEECIDLEAEYPWDYGLAGGHACLDYGSGPWVDRSDPYFGFRFTKEEHRCWDKNLKALQEGLRKQ